MGTLVNGIKEIFATSQTTATHLPVCASDGTPQGRIAVGDLASVLGGMKYKDASGLDMNDVTTTGAYSTTSSTQNQPTTYATIIVYNTGGNVVQTAYNIYGSEYAGSPHIWSRIRINGAWTSWISINDGIPTFYKNYNDLASLRTDIGRINNTYNTNSTLYWNYNGVEDYKADFESWFGSAQPGVHIGIMDTGSVRLIIGMKVSNTYGHYGYMSYGTTGGVVDFCDIRGTFTWYI